MAIQRDSCFCNEDGAHALRALVITDSLCLENEQVISELIDLGKEFPIQVIFTPTSNGEIEKHLKNSGASILSYHGDEQGIWVSFELSSMERTCSFFLANHYEGALSPCVQDSYVRSRDHVLFNSCSSPIRRIHQYRFDFFVVSATDTFMTMRMPELKKPYYVSPSKFIEYANIIMNNWQLFFVSPNSRQDAFSFYIEQANIKFPSFLALAQHMYGKSDLEPHFESLRRRVNYIIRSLQKIQYQFLLRRGNEGATQTEYYFGYMIMLMTGSFDSIAWIVNHHYQLKLNKAQVDLRKMSDPKNKKARTILEEQNSTLWEIIQQENDNINLFYPLRDSLQHRVLVESGQLTIATKFANHDFYDNHYICLEKETSNELLDKTIRDNPEKFGVLQDCGNRIFLHPYQFSTTLFETFTQITNRFLEAIVPKEV